MPRRQPRRRARSGDGTVFQRSDGKWVAAVSIGGRGDRRNVRRIRETEAAAVEALRRLRSERSSSTLAVTGAAPTLDVYLAQWLAAKQRQVRPKTYRQYESVVRVHVLPVLGSVLLDRIRPIQITAALRSLENGGASARTRELVVVVLRAALDAAVETGAIATNPIQRQHRPRVARKTLEVWTAAQARDFLAFTAGSPWSSLYRVALSLGLRRGELLALRWRDVDLERGRIRIEHTVTESGTLSEPKTRSARRTIDAPRGVVDALRALRTTAGKPTPTDRLWSILPRHLNTQLDVAIAALNETRPDHDRLPRIRVHDLRHTCATLLLEAGVDYRSVASILGHASPAITLSTYAHFTAAMGQNAATRMDAVLG